MGELTFVKYCPLCGAENPRQQPFCLQCADGDLSTVPAESRRSDIPSVITAALTEPVLIATSVILELVEDASFTFTIVDDQSVGRTEKADIILHGVPKAEWISGKHARFFRRGAQWYVQHIAQTNFIKVDGEVYRGQEEVAIYDGSILVLSLTAFRVRIEGEVDADAHGRLE